MRIRYDRARLYPQYKTSSFLVEDGRFLAFGEAAEGQPAQVVCDLKKGFVYPGLRDAHCHLLSLLTKKLNLDLSPATSLPDLIARSQAWLQARPEAAGLLGKGMNEQNWPEQRLPRKEELDAICKNRPVVFYRVCGHVAVVNTALLQRLPRLKERAADGRVEENDLALLSDLLPAPSQQERSYALDRLLNELAASGLTAISANDLQLFASEEDAAFLEKEMPRIENKLRYRSQYSPRLPLIEADLDTLQNSRPAAAVKVFKDGSLGGHTALLSFPYHDRPTCQGVSALDKESHLALARAASRRGLQLLTHAIGDQALEETLAIYDRVIEAGNPLRHAIVHAQLASDRQIHKMAEKNILAIVQPLFYTSDARLLPQRLGPRVHLACRFLDLDQSGVPLAFSSDAPVETMKPLATLAAARTAGFSFARALEHLTTGAAGADFAESDQGRLQVGYEADFVVFAKDLASLTPEQLALQTPLLTVLGGRVTHTREES